MVNYKNKLKEFGFFIFSLIFSIVFFTMLCFSLKPKSTFSVNAETISCAYDTVLYKDDSLTYSLPAIKASLPHYSSYTTETKSINILVNFVNFADSTFTITDTQASEYINEINTYLIRSLRRESLYNCNVYFDYFISESSLTYEETVLKSNPNWTEEITLFVDGLNNSEKDFSIELFHLMANIYSGNSYSSGMLYPHVWQNNGLISLSEKLNDSSSHLPYAIEHQILHQIGLSDLYSYSTNEQITSLSNDIMGSLGELPMNAYHKNKLGWFEEDSVENSTTSEILRIEKEVGTYTQKIYAINNFAQDYTYAIKFGITQNEYFVCEFRINEESKFSDIYKTGVVVYRVNSTSTIGNSNIDRENAEIVYIGDRSLGSYQSSEYSNSVVLEAGESIGSITSSTKSLVYSSGLGASNLFTGKNSGIVLTVNSIELNTTYPYAEVSITYPVEEYPIYSITFEVGSNASIIGNNVLYTQTANKDLYVDNTLETISSAPKASKTENGYTNTFLGWYTNAEGGDLVISGNGEYNFGSHKYSTFYTWKLEENIILYAQFEKDLKTISINFSPCEGGSISGNDVLYIKYTQNTLYTDSACSVVVSQSTFPIGIYNKKGYDSILEGWFINDETMLFDSENNLLSVSGVYEDDKWVSTESITVYPKFTLKLKVIAITLNLDNGGEFVDSKDDTTSDRTVYIVYGTSVFYEDEACQIETTIPSCTKATMGYNYEFTGWFITRTPISGVTYVISPSGELKKGYTNLVDDNGNWIDNSKTFTLYACYDQSINIFKITFVNSEDGGKITGVNSAYVTYNDENLYETYDGYSLYDKVAIPKASLEKEGYEATFKGWYTADGKRIIKNEDDTLTIMSGTVHTTITGKWNLTGDLNLYARFDQTALANKVNFITTDMLVALQGFTSLYIRYDSSTFYADVNCSDSILVSERPTATKSGVGYIFTFMGWYTEDSDDGIKILNSDFTFEKGVENYTDENGKWKKVTTTNLYPKFSQKEVAVKLTLSVVDEGATVSGNQDFYARYMSKYLYLDQDFYIQANQMPSVSKDVVGYDSTFLGWYTSRNGGKLVISPEGILEESVSGYTSSDGEWTATKETILYAVFDDKPHVSTITFKTDDKEVIVAGIQIVYVKYGDNRFYLEETCQNMTSLPTATKIKYGYIIEFMGWYSEDKQVFSKNGILQKDVEGITDTNGYWAYDENIELYSYIKETPKTICITFNTELSGGEIVGQSNLYINFDDSTFYKEQERLNKAQIPSATKNVEGYKDEFLGWYDSVNENANQIITTQNQYTESSVFVNGKLASLENLTLYAKFKRTPIVYKISLNAVWTNATVEKEQIYINYNENKFYLEETALTVISLPIPTKDVEGYDSNFEGYYLDTTDDALLVISKDGVLQKNITNITDAQGNWCGLENITLYAKFTYTKKVYQINFDASFYGGVILGSINKVFVEYQSNIYYNSKECVIEIQNFPQANCNKKGYTTTFLGWYSEETSGTKVVDENLNLIKGVENYTDSNGNWLPLETITLYAHFGFELNTYMITFQNIDNENDVLEITGNTTLYIEFNSNEFYLDADLTQKSTSFPTVSKSHEGYIYTFEGWSIKKDNELITIINQLNEVQKVLGYTCENLDEEWKYSIDSSLQLIPCFSKIGKIFSLKFEMVNNDEELIGNSVYYVRYGQDNLYDDENCEIITQSLPYGKKEITGYNVVFEGWKSQKINGEFVYDSSLSLQSSVIGIVSSGKWCFTETKTLYAEFSSKPKVFKITFDASQNQGYFGSKDSNQTQIYRYIEYNDKTFYEDEECKQVAGILTPKREQTGYTITFDGWYDENDNLVLTNTDTKFSASLLNITDSNGNWIYLSDLKLIAKFIIKPLVFKISLVLPSNAQIENNLTSLYVEYETANFYYDKDVTQKVETFPLPYINKKGYTVSLDGWYKSNDKAEQILNSKGEFTFLNTSYSQNGTWNILEDISLYAIFSEKANVYQITFDSKTTGGTKDDVIGYVQFDNNIIYKEDFLGNKLEKIDSSKTVYGYTTTFTGWYIDIECTKIICDTLLNLSASVENYTDIGSNWKYADNITLYAGFISEPNTYKVVFNCGDGEFNDVKLTEKTVEYIVLFDTNKFYKNNTVSSENLVEIPLAYHTLKGYTITFNGWKIANNIIIDSNGTFVETDGYIKNGLWNYAEDIELFADFTKTANTYKITFDPLVSEGGVMISDFSVVYLKYGTNVFYKDKNLTQETILPLAKYDVAGSEKVFSGWYTQEGVWVIDDTLNLVYSEDTRAYTQKTDNQIIWVVAQDITLKAKYVSLAQMVEITLDISDSEYSDKFESKTVYIEYGTRSIYLDKFKNFVVNNIKNKISLDNFDSKYYDFEFYGYYTEPNGKGSLIITKQNALITSDVQGYMVSGYWAKETKTTLFAHYEVSLKKFSINLDAQTNGGTISSTVERNFVVTYLQKGLLNTKGELTTVSATKKKSGYTCTFEGWVNQNNELVIDKLGNVLPSIPNCTNENGEWIISSNLTLYAIFDEKPITYVATFYNYDGTIFSQFDLNYGDRITLPSGTPIKDLGDDKQYVFRSWQGYVENQIILQAKDFYPIFEEFIRKDKDSQNQTFVVNTEEKEAKIYINDIEQNYSLTVNIQNQKIVINYENIFDCFKNVQTRKDYFVITLDKVEKEYTKKILKYVANPVYYEITIKQGETQINLTNGTVQIYLSYQMLEETVYPLKTWIVKESVNNKTEVDSSYDDSQNIMKVNLSSFNDMVIMIGVNDTSQRELFIKNLIKIIIIVVCSLVGLFIIVLITILIIKKIRKIVKQKKVYRKPNKLSSTEVNEGNNTLTRSLNKNGKTSIIEVEKKEEVKKEIVFEKVLTAEEEVLEILKSFNEENQSLEEQNNSESKEENNDTNSQKANIIDTIKDKTKNILTNIQSALENLKPNKKENTQENLTNQEVSQKDKNINKEETIKNKSDSKEKVKENKNTSIKENFKNITAKVFNKKETVKNAETKVVEPKQQNLNSLKPTKKEDMLKRIDVSKLKQGASKEHYTVVTKSTKDDEKFNKEFYDKIKNVQSHPITTNTNNLKAPRIKPKININPNDTDDKKD